MGQSKVITIVGNVAAGKTSAAPLIVNELGADFLDADVLFQTENPFRERYLADLPRWAFTNELWMAWRRAEMLEEAYRNINGKPLVIDSGLLMSWVYTYSHFLVGNISSDEWELFANLYGKFTKGIMPQMAVVMLQYSVPTLMKRLQMRGRDYELEYYTEEYVRQLDQGLLALKEMLLAQGVRVVDVVEDEVKDFVKYKTDKENLLTIVRGGL